MAKHPKPPTEYTKLRDQWYKKLKDEGFQDIERNNTLIEWSSRYGRKSSLGAWQEKAEYYSLARSFLSAYAFETELDKVIWEYHTEGISMRNIAATLTKAKIPMKKDSVWEVVKRLETRMKAMFIHSTEEHE